MVVIHPCIFWVIKRFPERKDILTELYKRNVSFQSICEDYQVCVETLKLWTNVDSDEAVIRRKEYGEFIQNLESEIMRCLNEDCP